VRKVQIQSPTTHLHRLCSKDSRQPPAGYAGARWEKLEPRDHETRYAALRFDRRFDGQGKHTFRSGRPCRCIAMIQEAPRRIPRSWPI
jgi:hypothetical protein